MQPKPDAGLIWSDFDPLYAIYTVYKECVHEETVIYTDINKQPYIHSVTPDHE